jgi:hypothetical protein
MTEDHEQVVVRKPFAGHAFGAHPIAAGRSLAAVLVIGRVERAAAPSEPRLLLATKRREKRIAERGRLAVREARREDRTTPLAELIPGRRDEGARTKDPKASTFRILDAESLPLLLLNTKRQRDTLLRLSPKTLALRVLRSPLEHDSLPCVVRALRSGRRDRFDRRVVGRVAGHDHEKRYD